MDPTEFVSDADIEEMARLLGHALFQAQYLEAVLVSLHGVASVEVGADTPREEMAKRFSQPLGVLVRDLEKIGVVGGIAEEIRRAHGLRNEIVHRFYKHYAPFVRSRAIFSKARSHLLVAFKTIESAAIRVELETERRIKGLGLPEDQFRKGAEEAMALYRQALETGEVPEDRW